MGASKTGAQRLRVQLGARQAVRRTNLDPKIRGAVLPAGAATALPSQVGQWMESLVALLLLDQSLLTVLQVLHLGPMGACRPTRRFG